MSRKPKQDDPEQSKRFVAAAREVEADESGEPFERALKKVVQTNPGPDAARKKN